MFCRGKRALVSMDLKALAVDDPGNYILLRESCARGRVYGIRERRDD